MDLADRASSEGQRLPLCQTQAQQQCLEEPGSFMEKHRAAPKLLKATPTLPPGTGSELVLWTWSHQNGSSGNKFSACGSQGLVSARKVFRKVQYRPQE